MITSPSLTLVPYQCVSCHKTGVRRQCRINPNGNWCASCKVRENNLKRSLEGRYVMSEEQRKKLSEAKRGKPCPWNSHQFSDEHRSRLSLARKGKTSWNKGKHFVSPYDRRLRETVHDCCSGMVRRVMKIIAEDKVRRTFEILGYSKVDFVSHIESLFQVGMSWSNYGKWQVDHIIPVSYYVKQGITDVGFINRLDNLRPLWKEDNLRKGGKLINA